MALILDPSLALTTLTTLARLQGRATVPSATSSPGGSCTRCASTARRPRAGRRRHLLRQRRRHAAVRDARARAWRWGTPFEALRPLLPAVDAALEWCAGPGDPDGDGYVEYRRSTPEGLRNQGWKDSHDAIHFADGELPNPRSRSARCRRMRTPLGSGGRELAMAAGEATTAARRPPRRRAEGGLQPGLLHA